MPKEIKPTRFLISEIKLLIEESKQQVATVVNTTLTMLYWNVGKKINEEILGDKRAEYGKQIVQSLAMQLQTEYGNGWNEKQLRHCLRFAETIQEKEIVSAVRRQLSWTHIKTIIYIDDELKRRFYIEMCKMENWSTRTLQERINSLLYERTAISKKPAATIKQDLAMLEKAHQITPDLVFRDPYFLDFLGLKDTYSEKDLESAIVAELQRFITELGSDFSFLARQKRILVDSRDYYIDLLFYHRRLKCLIAIDLKIGDFDAAYKGEMELYLGYLEKHEMVDGENLPIGLLLCSGKSPEHVELLQLHKSNIKVADYFTILPSKEILLDKLHKAISIAKNQMAQREND